MPPVTPHQPLDVFTPPPEDEVAKVIASDSFHEQWNTPTPAPHAQLSVAPEAISQPVPEQRPEPQPLSQHIGRLVRRGLERLRTRRHPVQTPTVDEVVRSVVGEPAIEPSLPETPSVEVIPNPHDPAALSAIERTYRAVAAGEFDVPAGWNAVPEQDAAEPAHADTLPPAAESVEVARKEVAEAYYDTQPTQPISPLVGPHEVSDEIPTPIGDAAHRDVANASMLKALGQAGNASAVAPANYREAMRLSAAARAAIEARARGQLPPQVDDSDNSLFRV